MINTIGHKTPAQRCHSDVIAAWAARNGRCLSEPQKWILDDLLVAPPSMQRRERMVRAAMENEERALRP